MKLGVSIPTWGDEMRNPGLDAALDMVEAAGLDSAWFGDHVLLSERDAATYPYWEKFHLPVEGDWFDAIVCATYAATRPSTLDIGFGVALAAVRPPLVLARQVASISHLMCGNRSIALGVGVGWSKAEHQAVGVEWRDRGRRLDDAIDLIRQCFTGEPKPGMYGSHYIPPGTFTNPPPVDPVPILIGGNAKAALRRTARQGDGWLGYMADWDSEATLIADAIGELATLCSQAGRAIGDLELGVVQTVPGRVAKDPESHLRPLLDRYAELGITQVVFGLGWRNVDGVRRFLVAANDERNRVTAQGDT